MVDKIANSIRDIAYKCQLWASQNYCIYPNLIQINYGTEGQIYIQEIQTPSPVLQVYKLYQQNSKSHSKTLRN